MRNIHPCTAQLILKEMAVRLSLVLSISNTRVYLRIYNVLQLYTLVISYNKTKYLTNIPGEEKGQIETRERPWRNPSVDLSEKLRLLHDSNK